MERQSITKVNTIYPEGVMIVMVTIAWSVVKDIPINTTIITVKEK